MQVKENKYRFKLMIVPVLQLLIHEQKEVQSVQTDYLSF